MEVITHSTKEYLEFEVNHFLPVNLPVHSVSLLKGGIEHYYPKFQSPSSTTYICKFYFM